jgi:hypothetical protein
VRRIFGSPLFTKDDQSVQYFVPPDRFEACSQRASSNRSELPKLPEREIDGIGVTIRE